MTMTHLVGTPEHSFPPTPPRRSSPPVRNPRTPRPPGAMKLTPIPWGKRDVRLGRMVCAHIQSATPPLVILWRPRMERITRLLAHCHVHDAGIEGINDLVDAKRHLSYRENV